jgi:hypothetical protein
VATADVPGGNASGLQQGGRTKRRPEQPPSPGRGPSRHKLWAFLGGFDADRGIEAVAALVGAAACGVMAWSRSQSEARRARRLRYGHALLDALGSAGVGVQHERAKAHHTDALDADGAAPESLNEIPSPLVLRGEPRDGWVNSQLVATLARRPAAKRAPSGGALHHHEPVLTCSLRGPKFD